VRSVLALIARADVTFVGVGAVGENAAIVQDGIVSREEAETLRAAGAVGEIIGWSFDSSGRLIENSINDRVASAPLLRPTDRLMIGVAMGVSRRAALRGALIGGLISGLVTDEATAEHLLQK
jgi:DNA-binding transcriptional regulator LsrR (DeoR family)